MEHFINYDLIQCPLCHSKRNEQVLKITNFDCNSQDVMPKVYVSVCLDCGMVYQNPCIHESIMRQLYSKIEDKIFIHVKEMTQNSTAFETYRRRDIVRKYVAGPYREKKLLEIGSSNGAFLNAMKAEGFCLSGVEPCFESVRKCQEAYSIEVANDFFENIDYNELFDVITHFFVLEHAFLPVQFLNKIHSIIKDDGVLIFEVPSLEIFPNLPYPIGYFPYQHISHFYKESIINLLNITGFSLLEIYSGAEYSSKSYGMVVIAKPMKLQKQIKNSSEIGKSLLVGYSNHIQRNLQNLENKMKHFLAKYGDGAICAIFGAGENGQLILSETNIKKYVQRIYIFDNNPNYQGRTIMGVSVFSPKEINKLNIDCVIIASIDYQEDIEAELIQSGVDPENMLKIYNIQRYSVA